MSLEKEPAGAFNKARRLIEWCQSIHHSRLFKGSAGLIATFPGERSPDERTCPPQLTGRRRKRCQGV